MKPPVNFDTLHAEYAKDTIIDKDNIELELMKIPSLVSKYANIRSHHKRKSMALEESYKDMRSKRASYYNGEFCLEDLQKEGWDQYQLAKPKFPSDMKSLLDNDPILNNILLKKQLQDGIVNDTEIFIKELQSRGYNLKAVVDSRRYFAGQT